MLIDLFVVLFFLMRIDKGINKSLSRIKSGIGIKKILSIPILNKESMILWYSSNLYKKVPSFYCFSEIYSPLFNALPFQVPLETLPLLIFSNTSNYYQQ